MPGLHLVYTHARNYRYAVRRCHTLPYPNRPCTYPLPITLPPKPTFYPFGFLLSHTPPSFYTPYSLFPSHSQCKVLSDPSVPPPARRLASPRRRRRHLLRQLAHPVALHLQLHVPPVAHHGARLLRVQVTKATHNTTDESV